MAETADLLGETREVLYGDIKEGEVTLEGLFSYVKTMLPSINDRIDGMSKTINEKLQKVEEAVQKIDGLCSAVALLQTKVNSIETDMTNLNTQCADFDKNLQGLSNIFDDCQTKLQGTEQELAKMKTALTKCSEDYANAKMQMIQTEANLKRFFDQKSESLKKENEELKDHVLDMRCRSMKYNLIFTGIKEHRNENTEQVLRMFLSEELGLEEWFEFGNVHRFGRHNRNRQRPIVAKFLYQWQLDLVLDSARFLRGRQYGINRQFPQEIEQARRSLYPVMKQMRSEGKQVKLVRDMLFVDGELYEPNGASGIHDSPQAHASTRDEHLAAWGIRTPSHGESFLRTPTHRPNKRQRYGSTPENTSR